MPESTMVTLTNLRLQFADEFSGAVLDPARWDAASQSAYWLFPIPEATDDRFEDPTGRLHVEHGAHLEYSSTCVDQDTAHSFLQRPQDYLDYELVPIEEEATFQIKGKEVKHGNALSGSTGRRHRECDDSPQGERELERLTKTWRRYMGRGGRGGVRLVRTWPGWTTTKAPRISSE